MPRRKRAVPPSGRRLEATSADGEGVCHLAGLIAALENSELTPFLLEHASHRFGELGEDMQAFALKTEALLRRALRNRDEEDAYVRAITHIVGAKSICLPWREEINIG